MSYLKSLYSRIPDSYKKFAYGAISTYVATQYGPAGSKALGLLLSVAGKYLAG